MNNTMNKILSIIAILTSLIIFLYPTISISNTSGSVGGKSGSPTDNASCSACHYAGIGFGATISSDIPSSGYIAGNLYTISANINQQGINKFGFEITAEEENNGSAKTGTFFVTNNTETKFVNSNTAITHQAAGTSGTNSKSWSMNWEAPATGTGAITFYGAFLAANGDQSNSGDTYHSASLTIDEAIIQSSINLSNISNINFNSITKEILVLDNKEISIYSISGKLVLSSRKKHINLTSLSKGTYIIKSGNETLKIILN